MSSRRVDMHQFNRRHNHIQNAMSLKMTQLTNEEKKDQRTHNNICWSPQDLTKETLDGYDDSDDDIGKSNIHVPKDDYIQKYQANPQELWPVEFFIIAYRRCKNKNTTNKLETQILVRESANGTSKYGLGTGVPVTRWMPSSMSSPPIGYERAEPNVSIDASCFPEFPKDLLESGGGGGCWSYDKIHMMANAFSQPTRTEDSAEFQDVELEEYSKQVREQLMKQISEQQKSSSSLSTWESIRLNVIQNVMKNSNCPAAVQGTLRMSGLFQPREGDKGDRYISLSSDNDDSTTTLDPSTLAKSMRVYTMFPQMPEPMPMPSTSAQELKEEILSRPMRMKESGRDPHQDKYGRKYTHISTSNVSNTIHGIYLPVDMTDILPEDAEDDDAPPALDLFGTKRVKRYWKSLQDLKVLDDDNEILTTEDPKPTFISGFIVRQLVKEGVIDIHG